MSEELSTAWYAIWTRSRHEKRRAGTAGARRATRRFSRPFRDGAAGRIERRRSTGRSFPDTVSRVLTRASGCRSCKCTGVVNIVSFDGDIAPIPDFEIDGIRRLVESDLQFDPCPLIREGMMVEVDARPAEGGRGRLLRKGAHARLILAVDLIGQAVSVEVDAADVRPYKDSPRCESRVLSRVRSWSTVVSANRIGGSR